MQVNLYEIAFKIHFSYISGSHLPLDAQMRCELYRITKRMLIGGFFEWMAWYLCVRGCFRERKIKREREGGGGGEDERQDAIKFKKVNIIIIDPSSVSSFQNVYTGDAT